MTDCSVEGPNLIEHGLELYHIGPLGPLPERRAGIGVLDAKNGGVVDQLNVIAVIIAENVHGVIALLCQILTAPLGQTVAGCGRTVAEFRGQRFDIADAADIGIEDLVHDLVDVLIGVASMDVFLVVCG